MSSVIVSIALFVMRWGEEHGPDLAPVVELLLDLGGCRRIRVQAAQALSILTAIIEGARMVPDVLYWPLNNIISVKKNVPAVVAELQKAVVTFILRSDFATLDSTGPEPGP